MQEDHERSGEILLIQLIQACYLFVRMQIASARQLQMVLGNWYVSCQVTETWRSELVLLPE